MSAKKTILILCDWFLPGFLAGGPIQSIATLTKQLDKELDFKIITTDRDFKSNRAYGQVPINSWTLFEGRHVFYVSPENMNPAFILALINTTPHDTLYLNSLFSKLFTIYPLKWKQQGRLRSSIVLAPRGMLRDGALAVKPLKKQLFLMYAKLTGLFKQLHWQSTSAQETAEIKKRIGAHTQVSQVSNLPAVADEITFTTKAEGALRLCFIARIVDIKNLLVAIEVLKEIKDVKIVFDVYGPKEDEAYYRLCEQHASTLPANVSFAYQSVLKPEAIASTLNQYHALFLPTQTENFGHIIVETLTNGRPVIISDQTPWHGLEEANAGFDIGLNNKVKFIEAIHILASTDQQVFNKKCMDSAAYITKQLNLEDIKQQYIILFNA